MRALLPRVVPGQTDSGRYLSMFFIHKPGKLALVISARDMDRDAVNLRLMEQTRT